MNSVSNCHGSIRIKLAETELIVAAKVDLGIPAEESPHLGRIDFLVDWLVRYDTDRTFPSKFQIISFINYNKVPIFRLQFPDSIP